MTNAEIVLCTDLDRTVIPNGAQPESHEARPRLRRLAARPEATLVYVTGRHKALLEDAIRDYDLPIPHYAIGDVGTTIYQVRDGEWRPWDAWSDEIAPDWKGHDRESLAELLQGLGDLRLQEPEKQNDFKLSYYAPTGTRPDALLAEVRQRLDARGVRASLIWSIDEAADCGLLDVLPAAANKLHAIRFLMREKGFSDTQTVFSATAATISRCWSAACRRCWCAMPRTTCARRRRKGSPRRATRTASTLHAAGFWA